MISHTAAFASLLGLFAVSSVVFTFSLVQSTEILSHQHLLPSTRVDTRSPRDDYTYVADDFPSQMLGFDPGSVQMVEEETVRFSLWDPEAPEEWASTSPPGEGAERLGPDGRLFYPSMFHELHCLRRFRHSLVNRTFAAHPAMRGHNQHCLNYLRQCALCRADRTLEPGDFAARNFTTDRVGAMHTCRDWRAVYDRVTYDWSNWKDGAAAVA